MSSTATSPVRTLRASISRHRTAWNAAACTALAVFCAAFGIVGLWSVFSVLQDDVSPWWSLAVALPAVALLPLRERAPWLTLVLATALWVLDMLTVGGLVPLIVMLDVLYGATVDATPGERHRVRESIVVAVLLLGSVSLLRTGDIGVALLIALQLGALIGMTYWYATSVAQATELLVLHEERAADAARLAEQERVDAVHREREDMARELHDLVAGHVSAMAIRAEAALSAPPDADRDRAALRAVRDSSLDAHAALRSMIAVLRADGDAAAPARRHDAVPELVAGARRSGLHVHVDDTITGELPAQVDHAVTRIVQEALANCARHAAGADVRIELAGDDEISVRVDSRGGAPIAAPALEGSGWGLELLAERTRALGGTFRAASVDGGFRVHAVIPREVPI